MKIQEIETQNNSMLHSDQIILNSGSNALQFAKNEDFFNPMTISPSITAIPKNIFKAFFISSYLRLRGNGHSMRINSEISEIFCGSMPSG